MKIDPMGFAFLHSHFRQMVDTLMGDLKSEANSDDTNSLAIQVILMPPDGPPLRLIVSLDEAEEAVPDKEDMN